MMRPGLVDQLAEPFEVGSAARAAGVAHMGCDVAAGELQMGLAKRGQGFESLVIRDLVDLAARIGQTLDLLDQSPMFARHESTHIGQVVGQHRRPMRDLEEGDDRRDHAALGTGLAAEVERRRIHSFVNDPFEEADVGSKGLVVKRGIHLLGDAAEGLDLGPKRPGDLGHRGIQAPTASSDSRACAAWSIALKSDAESASISTWTRMNQCSS